MPEPVTVQRLDYVRTFPWLRIGRAVGCALSLQALFIAVIGVLLVDFTRVAVVTTLQMDGQQFLLAGLPWMAKTPPVQDALLPLWSFAKLPISIGWKALLIGTAATLIWSFVGVALCRCAALEFCRDESASFRGSVQHAVRRFASPWGALATPLFGTAVLMVLIALIALPAFLPALGGVWVRLLSPVIAIFGIMAAFILLVLPVMWPLMIAAVAVDDSDGFDAFSRSFSFVTSHPWMTAGLFTVGGAMLVVCGTGIDLLIEAAAGVTLWSGSWTASDTQMSEHLLPATLWWIRLFARAALSSLFWSLATVVYVFLRQATDGAPLDQLSGFDLPGLEREQFPVVGIPAMNPPASASSTDEAMTPLR